MKSSKEFVELRFVCHDFDDAYSIAAQLVREKLVASSSTHSVSQTYLHRGSVVDADTVVVTCQTTRALFEVCEKAVNAMHPHRVVQVDAVPLVRIGAAHAARIRDAVIQTTSVGDDDDATADVDFSEKR